MSRASCGAIAHGASLNGAHLVATVLNNSLSGLHPVRSAPTPGQPWSGSPGSHEVPVHRPLIQLPPSSIHSRSVVKFSQLPSAKQQ